MDLADAVCEFFGLSTEEFMHLFVPRAQTIEQFGGEILKYDAIPEDVAINIFEMVNGYLMRN